MEERTASAGVVSTRPTGCGASTSVPDPALPPATVAAAANSIPIRDDAVAMPCAAKSFTVTIDGHGSASCRPDERVLVALERAQGFGRLKGLPRKLPVGCRRGGCGICRARVIEGSYRTTAMSREHVSAEEESAGVVLSCAIYPLTDLTLRLEPANLGKSKGQKAMKS